MMSVASLCLVYLFFFSFHSLPHNDVYRWLSNELSVSELRLDEDGVTRGEHPVLGATPRAASSRAQSKLWQRLASRNKRNDHISQLILSLRRHRERGELVACNPERIIIGDLDMEGRRESGSVRHDEGQVHGGIDMADFIRGEPRREVT